MLNESRNTGPNTMGGWFRDRYWPGASVQLDSHVPSCCRRVLPDGGGHPEREDVDKPPDAVENAVPSSGRDDRPGRQTDARMELPRNTGGCCCPVNAEDTDDCVE